jgi:hypothetical protein
MKKHKLYTEISYDFGLVGISSHEKPYKLAWAINQKLGLDLKLMGDLEIKEKAKSTVLAFARYCFLDEQEVEYNLLSNKSENGFLIPDLNNFDFFLQLSGNSSSEIRDKIIKELRRIDIVNAAMKLDPNCLRKKDRFIY